MTQRLLTVLICTLIAVAVPACQWLEPAPSEAEANVQYTCGMHPQVVQDGPGSCPLCGMDLTPMKGDAQSTDAGGVDVPSGVIQQIGVETLPVEQTTVFRRLCSPN